MGNGPRVQQLRLDLAICKQKRQPVASYYGRLKSLWDELNNYDPIPVCSCTGCKCNLTKELERRREEEKVHKFLMGLNEEAYGATRLNILSAEQLPNLNRSYDMVIQQERAKKQEDRRKRDARMADLADGDSILILSMYDGLLILDLNGKQRCHKRPRHKPIKTPRIDPIVLKVIDFESKVKPQNMSVMRLGDKGFFLFGGEYSEYPFRDDIKTNRVYKLNPDNNWTLKLTKEVKRPDVDNVSHVVEEVNGKIFVLQDFYKVKLGDKPRPIFDVYDITSNTWNKILSKKSWSEEKNAITSKVTLHTYFFVGCRMYIVLANMKQERWFFCFNTDSFKWEKKNASNLRNSLKVFGGTIRDVAVCVSGIENLDDNLNVIIYKDQNDIVIAYLINDSGSLVYYQELSRDLYLGLDIYKCRGGASLINHKSGGGRMCLVIRTLGDNDDEGENFVIRHFELKLKQGFEEEVKKLSAGGTFLMEREFLKVKIYKNQWCRKTGLCTGLKIGLRRAFFF